MSRWKAYEPEQGETVADAVPVPERYGASLAYDAETAAELFAEAADDNTGGEVSRAGRMLVAIIDTSTGAESRWRVAVDYSPSYSAYAVGESAP